MCRYVFYRQALYINDVLDLVCRVLVHKRCHKSVITSCGDKGRAQSLIVKADEVHVYLLVVLLIKIISHSCPREHNALALMSRIGLRSTITKHQHFATTVVPCFGES